MPQGKAHMEAVNYHNARLPVFDPYVSDHKDKGTECDADVPADALLHFRCGNEQFF